MCSIRHFTERNVPLRFYEFYFDYCVANVPCIFPASMTKDWPCMKKWAKISDTGAEIPQEPNYEYLARFNNSRVEVTECDDGSGDTNCKEMLFGDFLEEILNTTDKRLYVKNWHLQKEYSDEKFYTLPDFLASDWLNEYFLHKDDPVESDYRFVYMGNRDSWTPYHADVFGSFSWSVNVFGRKLWYLTPPGLERDFLKLSQEHGYGDKIDLRHFENSFTFRDTFRHVITCIQYPGEIIFVPSNWFHQVHNLDVTLSINHNWFNSSNIDKIFEYMKLRLYQVQEEISDCRDIFDEEQWQKQCQMILKADLGMNVPEFKTMLKVLASKRNFCLDAFSGEQAPTRDHFRRSCTCLIRLCPSCSTLLRKLDCSAISEFQDKLSQLVSKA